MTSFLTQTVAREQIAGMIAAAQADRVRRDVRRARRQARLERRQARRAAAGPSNSSLYAPGRIGLAGVR
jgi:hypothetical protein